jgi:hypothetical protein
LENEIEYDLESAELQNPMEKEISQNVCHQRSQTEIAWQIHSGTWTVHYQILIEMEQTEIAK